MKNKLSYIGIFLLLCFFGINSVYADEFIINAITDSLNVTKGNEVSIKINLKASEFISECLFKFEYDGELEYVGLSGANGWGVKDSGVTGVSLSNNAESGDAPTTGINIAELKYKVNGSGNVVIKTLQCVAMVSETSYKHDDQKLSFTAKDPTEDTTLSDLKVTNGVMTPSNVSSSHKGNYVIDLSSSTFGLSMTASNPDFQDKIVVKDINGNVITDVSNITFSDPTGQGQMPLDIIVNDKTKYSLLVTYTGKNLDNSLATLVIGGKELTLIDGVYEYEFTVGKDVTTFDVAATIKDNENFEFADSEYAPGKYNIINQVTVSIKVSPKDSSSGAKAVTYTIEVTREGAEDIGTSGSGGSSGSSGGGNVSKNPVTADIPMFFMGFVLVISLIGSVVLYRKNLESYK